MPRTTLFVASSNAAKSQAKAFVRKFQSATLQFLPWWEAFTAGRTLLEDLNNVANRSDAAIIVMSPESTTTIRGHEVEIPNLNVLLEFGYLYGRLGKDKVAVVRYGDYYLPSDLGGYIDIFGSTYFKRAAVVQIAKRTEREFERWVATV